MFDTNSNFDIVTNKGRYTAPISGFYSFSANLIWSLSSAGQSCQCFLQKNGSDYIRGHAFVITYNGGGADEGAGLYAPLVQLTAGDYVSIRGVVGSVGMDVGSTPIQSWFSGYLVSVT